MGPEAVPNCNLELFRETLHFKNAVGDGWLLAQQQGQRDVVNRYAADSVAIERAVVGMAV